MRDSPVGFTFFKISSKIARGNEEMILVFRNLSAMSADRISNRGTAENSHYQRKTKMMYERTWDKAKEHVF